MAGFLARLAQRMGLTRREALGPALTSGYTSPWNHHWGKYPRDLPPFTFITVQTMLIDPTIKLGLAMRSAPLYGCEFAHKEGEEWTPGILAESEDVAAYVKRQIDRIWQNDLDALLVGQIWGWSGGEVTLREINGRVEVDRLLQRHANDTRAIVRDGKQCGVRVLRVPTCKEGYVDLGWPKAFWHAYQPESGSVYGFSALLGAYSPWFDKWMDGGGLDVRRLFMHKDAYAGADMTYPEGVQYVPGKGEIPNRDIARELVEQVVSGGVTARPAAFDDKGNELWKLTRATVASNPGHILQYPKDLDTEILRGLGIPDDVLTADGTGAWAGKRIPMAAFYASLDTWLASVIRDVNEQIIKPLVQLNFGGGQSYSIQTKPLAEQAMEQQGSAKGDQQQQPGGGFGQQPNFDPFADMQQQGQPGRMSLERIGAERGSAARLVEAARRVLAIRLGDVQRGLFGDDDQDPWVPYAGPRGGHGWRHVRSGEIAYGDKPTGDKPKPKPLEIETTGAGRQQNLFAKKGLPGQQNLFSDAGVPDDMVAKTALPRNYGYDRVKMGRNLSFDELKQLRESVEQDPANQTEPGSFYKYTPAARKKLGNIAWAITNKMNQQPEDAQPSPDKGKLSEAIADVNGKNAPPGGWGDQDEVKDAPKPQLKHLQAAGDATPKQPQLTGMHKQSFDAIAPVMERQIGKETSNRRQVQVAVSHLEGESPAVQQALSDRVKELAPDAYRAAASGEVAVPIGLKKYFRMSVATDSLRWITIGGRKEGDKEHVGGFPVQINGEGQIVRSGGHPGLVGKKISDVGKFFKRSRGQKKAKKQGGDILKRQAAKWEMDPKDYQELADQVWDEQQQHHTAREKAKQEARRRLGVTSGQVKAWEDAGLDWSSRKVTQGFDTLGRELASQYPQLGWGGGYGDEDSAETEYDRLLWELVREGKQDLPARSSEEFHAAVDDYLNALADQYDSRSNSPAETDWSAVPFGLRAPETLVGGPGDDRPDEDFDLVELERGTLHEMEHTDDVEIAKEIAKDHLSEDPEYYRKLGQMENE